MTVKINIHTINDGYKNQKSIHLHNYCCSSPFMPSYLWQYFCFSFVWCISQIYGIYSLVFQFPSSYLPPNSFITIYVPVKRIGVVYPNLESPWNTILLVCIQLYWINKLLSQRFISCSGLLKNGFSNNYYYLLILRLIRNNWVFNKELLKDLKDNYYN